jgi:hypothetical protein
MINNKHKKKLSSLFAKKKVVALGLKYKPAFFPLKKKGTPDTGAGVKVCTNFLRQRG